MTANRLSRLFRIFVFSLFSLLTAESYANTCYSRSSTDWSSTSTWECYSTILIFSFQVFNVIPGDGDYVVIRSGNSVRLNTNPPNLRYLEVQNNASLLDDGNARVITLGKSAFLSNYSSDLIINGTIDIKSGLGGRISLQSSSDWSGAGTLVLDYLDTNFYTLTLDTASTVLINLSDASPIRNIASFNNGSSTNKIATVYLSGGAQNVPIDYLKMPNLKLSGGIKTMLSGAQLTILGSLTIDAGATFDAQSNGTTSGVFLAGNLTINGTLQAMGSNANYWTFNGSSAQTISAAAALRGVTLNNTLGLTLGGNLTVGDSSYGPLTLAKGKLTTGSYSVIIPRNCSGSMVTRTAGSWINGNEQLTMPAYNASCLYDIGDANNYAPATFTYPWNSPPLGGTVTISSTAGDHPDTTAGTSGITASKSVNRYWSVSAGSGSTFYTYDATFQYCSAAGTVDCTVNDVDSGATASSFVVGKKSGGTWSSSTPSSPSANSRQVTGLTAFGAFAIGQSGSANSCPQPSNTPAGLTLTCQCDSFGRASLNPSTMFTNGNWTVSTSDTTGIVPYVNASSGFLRLTEVTGNNAKAATVPGFLPSAGNYISVEFKHYSYGGTLYNGRGGDGMAATLSDYTVPPVPGGYGGSLGYAQKNGASGFAGGWLGIALDEYGNFSDSTETRVGGIGVIQDAIVVRGSGAGTTGYPYLKGNSASLSPGIDNISSSSPSYGHFYQIIVDARNSASGQTMVAVNRDTTGTGNSYAPVLSSFDIFAAAKALNATQAPIPTNMQLSFTGSSGGATNIHELGEVRVCAQYFVPPDGALAGGFSAIDDAYVSSIQNFQSGHIYTKLAGTPFKLKVAALANSQIQTNYAASGTKNLTIKLVDNSDGLCGTDTTRATACATAACNGKSAVTGGSQTMAFTSADQGIRTSADFTLNTAHANLVAVMSEGGVTACSVDSFSVRPTKITSVTSSATNAALTGSPKFKAGTDSFTLTATVNAGGYNGSPKINPSGMSATNAAWALGSLTPALFSAATPGASTSVATSSFTYSEVGNFRFLGYDPALDTSSARGIYDDSWVTVDSVATRNDCVANSYANTKDASGKYGCLFGLQDSSASAPNSALFGRFVPDHFAYIGGGLTPYCSASTFFTYMGQAALGLAYRLEARNGSNAVTTNYSQALGYPVSNPVLVAEDQATNNQGCDLSSRLSSLPTAQWASGVYAFNAKTDNTPNTATAAFSRPVTPVALTNATCTANKANAGGPFTLLDIGVSLSDSDAGAILSEAPTAPVLDMNAATTGVCSGAGCTAHKIGTTAFVYGRLWLNNAYGSEMLPLPVPVQAQYWSASGWQKNTYDSCTSLTQPTRQDTGNSGLVFYAPPNTARNALAPGEVVAQMGGSTAASVLLSSGDARMVLRGVSASVGPGTGNFGYVDIIGSKLISASWLPPSGNARACFGACGPRSPVIYFRENY